MAFDILQCTECDLIYTDIVNFNPDDYYTENYYKVVYPDYAKDKKVHRINSENILKKISRIKDTGSICEIGCAFGFFLDAARDKGWDTFGYEISDYSRNYASDVLKLNVKKDFLDDNIDRKFDFICMFDTIEHLENPSAIIEKCYKTLNPGGCILITTGDAGSIHAGLTGKKWRLLTPPLHLYYYTKATITSLLNKHSFEVKSINYSGKSFNLFSIIQYLFKIKSSNFPVLPLRINTFDVMSVLAIKK